MLKIARYFWGDLTQEEFKKFGLLSLTFFFLIGTYWLLRTQKDAVFNTIVGFENQPIAKMLSVFMILPLILIYSKLVDIFSKNKLIIVLSSFYTVCFVIVAIFLNHPTIGLPNTVASTGRFFGWFIYIFIESFGSLMPGLFWAFVTSSTKSESAKKGYPMIIAGAQVGSLLGSYMSWKSRYFGNALLFKLSGVGIFAIVPTILLYLWIVPPSANNGVSAAVSKRPKTGAWEGLWILLTRPYVLGIFALATLYEIVGTILDFQMKMLAKAVYTTTASFAAFNGMFGLLTNGVALLFAVMGTGMLFRRFGLRFCLMLFPLATGTVISVVFFKPALFVVLFAMITIKALSYALNNPSKEMMYIPTTKDVRFKAKGWVDMFGSRSSKGTGAFMNYILKTYSSNILLYGTMLSLGIVGVWVAVASYVGHTFKRLTDNNEVID